MKEISEEQKSKAAFQFKGGVREILESVYNMYGYQESQLTTEVIEQIMELAVLYAKRMRGIDVPIAYQVAQKKLIQRNQSLDLNGAWH
jgi:hypothetical protein